MDVTDRSASGVAAPEAESGAFADAAEIVRRAATDAGAADEARARFRRDGIPTLQPDGRIAPCLDPGEHLVAVRQDALLDRREPPTGDRPRAGAAGELCVTSRRLLLVGRLTLEVPLETIEDVVLSGERLLLVLQEGRGITLQVAQPRLLCVEIAAARAAARSARAPGPPQAPPAAPR